MFGQGLVVAALGFYLVDILSYATLQDIILTSLHSYTPKMTPCSIKVMSDCSSHLKCRQIFRSSALPTLVLSTSRKRGSLAPSQDLESDFLTTKVES